MSSIGNVWISGSLIQPTAPIVGKISKRINDCPVHHIFIFIIFSGLFHLCVACSEDYVPERRAHPEASLFSSEMMLVVVLLKFVEKSACGF